MGAIMMIRSLSVAVMLLVSALISQPAEGQSRPGVSSLTHVVYVTVPARVKVRVSSLSLAPGSVPAAVKVDLFPASMTGLALRVHANKAWVLSVSAPAASGAPAARVQWSESHDGEFTAITAADSLLATGTPTPATVDTTVFFRGTKNGAVVPAPVMLTVSAP